MYRQCLMCVEVGGLSSCTNFGGAQLQTEGTVREETACGRNSHGANRCCC